MDSSHLGRICHCSYSSFGISLCPYMSLVSMGLMLPSMKDIPVELGICLQSHEVEDDCSLRPS
jgi:hypothetical protein